jgi:hypothetical protein
MKCVCCHHIPRTPGPHNVCCQNLLRTSATHDLGFWKTCKPIGIPTVCSYVDNTYGMWSDQMRALFNICGRALCVYIAQVCGLQEQYSKNEHPYWFSINLRRDVTTVASHARSTFCIGPERIYNHVYYALQMHGLVNGVRDASFPRCAQILTEF